MVYLTLFSKIGQPLMDLFADSKNSPTSNLLQQGKGLEGLHTRCDVDWLELGTMVCLPTNRPHPSGPGEILQV